MMLLDYPKDMTSVTQEENIRDLVRNAKVKGCRVQSKTVDVKGNDDPDFMSAVRRKFTLLKSNHLSKMS